MSADFSHLRDFNVEDPDGNTITIGSVTEQA